MLVKEACDLQTKSVAVLIFMHDAMQWLTGCGVFIAP